MKRLVILNPHSRNGTGGRIFARRRSELERKLGRFELYETQARGDATAKVKSVLESGEWDQILIAGGDGSINEAACGYWAVGGLSDLQVPLGVINLGTGGDFYRSVTGASPAYKEALITNRFRRVDLVTVRSGGEEFCRPFLNISSVGMAGEMLRNLKQSRFQVGAAAYFFHTVKTLVHYRPVPVSISWIDSVGVAGHREVDLLNLFVCNGRFSGGGMEWAPRAVLDSGDFQVTVVAGSKKWPLVRHSGKLYRGQIDEFPGATTFSAREVTVRCESALSLEADGEIVTLPDAAESRFDFQVHRGIFPLVL